jgi:hypothetical protein
MTHDPNRQHLVGLLEQALKQWHREDAQIPLDDALPHLVRQTAAAWHEKSPPVVRRMINQLLLDLLEALAEVDAEAATLLRRRYFDDETGFAVANSLGISESAFYRRRRDALQMLADIALSREREAQSDRTAKLESRLEPSSYHQLFGVTDLRNRLSELLDPQSDIKLICLTGIGGIGKTALADALAREAIAGGKFDDLAWISARQQQFGLSGEIQETGYPVLTPDELIAILDQQLSGILSPPRPAEEILSALKARLARGPHLLILDNLETTADYQEIFPLLRELSQFAWILVTSRVGVYDQPGVHITNLIELNLTDAEALVRDEALRRGLNELAEAPDGTIAQIYSIAGGNPLALKLIIGQVQVRSLSTVLDDFSEARGWRVEALYEFIYRRAWDLLDDVSRRVLLAMPLVAAPGAKLEHLAGVTGLTGDDLYDALDLLVRLSLVTVGGPLDERRYQIHRLTETFLHKQVTKWT